MEPVHHLVSRFTITFNKYRTYSPNAQSKNRRFTAN